ncbi:MAG: hypothetical protein HY673_04985 [Chloroflexi bacterium]|nr:hypothetical protein [Chloroflexota bacterium]
MSNTVSDSGKNRGTAPGDIILAEQFNMPELPAGGLFWLFKALHVYPGHQGLVTKDGHIIRPPVTGPDKGIRKVLVAWRFLRQGRGAVRVFTNPVNAEVELPSLNTGDWKAVAVKLPLKLQVADPVLFYNNLLRGRPGEYTLSAFEADIAPAAGKPVQRWVNGYAAQSLLEDDGNIGQGLADGLKLDPAGEMKNILAARGLALVECSSLAFALPEEPGEPPPSPEELAEKARTQSLEELLRPWEKAATAGDIKEVKAAFARSSEEGQKAWGALVDRLEQQRERALEKRARQLERVEGVAAAAKPSPAFPVRQLSKLGIYLAIVLILGAASAWLTIFKSTHYQTPAGAGAALVMVFGFMLLIQAVVDHAMARALPQVVEPMSKFMRSLMPWRAGSRTVEQSSSQAVKQSSGQAGEQPAVGSRQPVVGSGESAVGGQGSAVSGLQPAPTPAPEAVPIPPAPLAAAPRSQFLADWLKNDAMKADKKVRGQVSRELTRAVSSINDARLSKPWSQDREGAVALKKIADDANTFRTSIEIAPAHDYTAVKEWKGHERELAARLIAFLEELLRQGEAFASASARLQPGADDAGPPGHPGADGPQPRPPATAPTPETLAAMLRRMEKHWEKREAIFNGILR